MTKVSVVFTALNEEGCITRLLVSLSRQTVKPFEVICIDAGSVDGTENAFNSFRMELSNLKFIVKEGIQDCMALNYAASMASGEVILFTGAAVAFPSRSIEIIASHFDSEPKLAAIAGKPIIAESAPVLLRMEYELWNNVAIGAFDEPPFHLVRGGDDKNPPILERLGLTNIKFEEEKVAEEESQNRVGDRRVKVTPEIHKMMIKLHNTPNGKRETTSAMIIGLKLGFNEGTVKKEITRHQLNECVCED